MNIDNYVKSKEITIKELDKELDKEFSLVKEFEIERGDLSVCGCCNSDSNTKRLPSEPWTSALYCWVCKSITLMIHADRMSGNHTDCYRVYKIK